jgi:hypothetical protein
MVDMSGPMPLVRFATERLATVRCMLHRLVLASRLPLGHAVGIMVGVFDVPPMYRAIGGIDGVCSPPVRITITPTGLLVLSMVRVVVRGMLLARFMIPMNPAIAHQSTSP